MCVCVCCVCKCAGLCGVPYVCMCMLCACFVGIILYVLDSGSSTAWGKWRLEKGKERRSQEEEEKKKIPIVGEGYPGGTTYLEVSPHGKIQYIPFKEQDALLIRG